MANALARETAVRYIEGVGLQILLDVAYFGNDVAGGGFTTEIEVTLPANPSAVDVRSAMSGAIATGAQARGFSCPGTNQTIPTWQKG